MEASDVRDDAITNIRKNLINILTTIHSEAIQKRGCVSLLWKQKKRFVKPAWFCSLPVKPTTFKLAAGVKSMISKRFTFLALSLIMITKHFKSCNCVSQLVSIYIRAERLIEWGCKLENYILRHLISLVNDSRHYSCLLYFTRSRKRCTNALPYVSLTARTETSLPAILSVWRTSSNTCFLYL